MLKKDMSTVPAQGKDPDLEGCPPDYPEVVEKIAVEWYKQYIEAGKDELAMAVDGATFRASQAGKCLRSIEYSLLSDETDPPGLADSYRFEIGTKMHDSFQEIIQELYPDAEVEVIGQFSVTGETFGAVHIDVVIPDPKYPGYLLPIEIKTVGGFKFKLLASTFKGVPEGPGLANKRQLAMEARALVEAGAKIKRGKLIYLSTENLSVAMAQKLVEDPELRDIARFAAEFDIDFDELDELADDQVDEFTDVSLAFAQNQLIDRIIPEHGGAVDNPKTGNGYVYDENDVLVDSFRAWQCNYCPYQTRCINDLDLKEW